MVKFVLVKKNGDLVGKEVSLLDMLYKKCKFRGATGFKLRHTWPWGTRFVSVYAKDTGKSGTANKLELPQPVDVKLFFGGLALIGHRQKEPTDSTLIDIEVKDWVKLYNKLMGGFEDLGSEDSYSDAESIPKELATNSGYMKDGFVVDDNFIENTVSPTEGSDGSGYESSAEEDESTGDADDESSELSEESYAD